MSRLKSAPLGLACVTSMILGSSSAWAKTIRQGAQAGVGTAILLGNDRESRYLAFGDSITVGVGSTDGGYRTRLQRMLGIFYGHATVTNGGVSGSSSAAGAARLRSLLTQVQPGITLIMYGTNDWLDPACHDDRPTCSTIPSLREMIHAVREARSVPLLATLPPVDRFAGQGGDPDVAMRERWVERTNERIRALALAEGVAVADIHPAFDPSFGLSQLFGDSVHPTDKGYDVIAEAFFRSITASRPLTAVSPLEPLTPQEAAQKVQPGDLVQLSVLGQAPLCNEFQVGPNGTLDLPWLGEVPASDLTLGGLQDRIRALLLDGYLKDPKVTLRRKSSSPAR